MVMRTSHLIVACEFFFLKLCLDPQGGTKSTGESHMHRVVLGQACDEYEETFLGGTCLIYTFQDRNSRPVSETDSKQETST